MTRFLQSGVAWLAGQLEAHAGETILYSRGGQTVQIPAVAAAVDVELLTAEEFHQRGRMLDWLVRCELVTFDGLHSEPQAGDRIQRTTAGLASMYEVAPVVGGAHFRPADPHGSRWRIHTKLISGASPT
jgi:hypothetical protein